jgi:hypothetical protein
MFSWLRVLVAKLKKKALTARKKIKNQTLAITILKKKKTAKTIARLAKPAVRDLFFLLF